MEINKLSIAFPAPAAKPVAEPTVSAPASKPVADKAKPEPIDKGIDKKDLIVKDDVIANENKVQHQKHSHGIVPLDAMIAAMTIQQNQPAPAITFAPGVGTPTADEATPAGANITIGAGDTKVEIAGEFAAVTPIKVLPPGIKTEFSGFEDAEALALKLKLNPGANAGVANVEATKASFTFATIQAAVPNPQPTLSATTKQPAEDVMHWPEDVHVWAEDVNYTAPAAPTKQPAEDVMHWPEDVHVWNEGSNIDPAAPNTSQPAEDIMHWPEDTHDWNADVSYTAPAPTTKQTAEDVMHWPEDVHVWDEGGNIDPLAINTTQPAEDVMHWPEDTHDWETDPNVTTKPAVTVNPSDADLLSKKVALNEAFQEKLQLDAKLKLNFVEELLPAADVAASQPINVGLDGDIAPASDIAVDSAFAESLGSASDVLATTSNDASGTDTGTPQFSTQAVDKSNATDNAKPEVKQLTAAESTSVLKQVADRLEVLAAARPKHGITVHLDPQEFGSITLIVKNSGRDVEAQIFANHDGVRAALEQNKAQLANNLESRGIALQSMTVSTDALNSQAFGDAQNRTHQSGRPMMTTRTLDVDSAQSGMTLEAIREFTRKPSGVDLWI